MKRKILMLSLLSLPMIGILSQGYDFSRIPLLGADAPSFSAQSTNGKINFPDDYKGKWKVLLSHPKDFTPVCSSELLELAQKQDEFDKLGVQLVVLSTDILDQHYAWKKTLDTLKYKARVPQVINFPLVDDADLQVSKMYGMLHNATSTSRDVRGVFIIDPNNKIRAVYFYPMEVGRNIDEIERTIVALQTSQSSQVLTPANWHPGDDVLIPLSASQTDSYRIAPFMFARKMK